jgi:hypothetical protein
VPDATPYPSRFEELALKITALPEGKCTVSVLQSSYGTPEAASDLSTLPTELPDVRKTLEFLSGCSREIGESDQIFPQGPGSHSAEERVGAALFRAIFTGPILRTFHLALGRADAAKGTGLRIRLAFDPMSTESSRISLLPWELLYREETREFLARNLWTPVVRCLEAPRLTAAAEAEPPLKMLVVLSHPSDTQELQLEKEFHRIERAIGQQGDISIRILNQPSLLEIRRVLLTETIHILHYMGHGTASEDTGMGFLIFAGDDGRSQRVEGPRFAEVAKIARSLRLVVLNACRTAQHASANGQDPYMGVASSLLMAGIPTVIAMRHPITDDAALAFSDHFYTSLAAGMPIDAAAAEARAAIYFASTNASEWATPALFMSTPDGLLFSRQAPQNDPPKEPTSAERTTPEGSYNTFGGTGGVTIGGSGNAITGGIKTAG